MIDWQVKWSVDTPYYKSQVEAICMKNPMFELIVGNIAGVTDQVDKIVTEVSNDQNDSLPDNSECLQATITRSQSAEWTC